MKSQQKLLHWMGRLFLLIIFSNTVVIFRVSLLCFDIYFNINNPLYVQVLLTMLLDFSRYLNIIVDTALLFGRFKLHDVPFRHVISIKTHFS